MRIFLKSKILKKIVSYLIIGAILFFIFRQIIGNFNQIKDFNFKFNVFYLVLSVFIYFTFIFINYSIWFYITKKNNCEIAFWETIKIKTYADIARYIPGRVFLYGLLFYKYQENNISKKQIAVCSFQEFIASLLSGVLISLVSLSYSNINELNKYKIYLIFTTIFCFILIHPKIINLVSNYFFKLFKKDVIKTTYKFKTNLNLLILNSLNTFILGFAYFLLIRSFMEYSFSLFFFTNFAFVISGLIGFFAIFAPAGIGVREGSLVFILSLKIPIAIASLIAISTRIWQIISELIFFILIYLIDFFIKRNKSSSIVNKS